MRDAAPPQAAPPAAPVGLVYAISLILAVCSLLYELLIAQTMTMIAGNIVVWYSLTIGIYLASMGYGSIIYGARPPSQRHGWRDLFTLEIALTAAGALAVPVLNFAHSLYLHQYASGFSEALSTLGFYGIAFVVTALVGLLTGIELPLLIHLGNLSSGERDVTNRVLGWDYIGALAAGVLFPLFLVPYVPLHTIGFAIAALNLAVALFVAARFLARQPRARLRLAGSAALGAVLVGCVVSGPAIEQYFLKRYYYYIEGSVRGFWGIFDPLTDMEPVFRASSPYQKIDLIHYPSPWDPIIEAYSTKFVEHPDKPRDHFLYLNGDNQFSSNFEELYHEWFAHVPIIASGRVPRRVLIMGGGDGILHRELVKYDGIEHITHVDIDGRLVALAKTDPMMTAVNEHGLDDPRVHTILGDGYQYIRNYAGEPFDAVYLDFPLARDYNLARLYSREFYTFVRQHLAEDGFVVLDAPRLWVFRDHNPDGSDRPWAAGNWDVLHHTLRKAGFPTVAPFFSSLESDNEDARRALRNSPRLQREIREANGRLDSQEAQEKWIEAYLGRLWRLRMGFVMARNDRNAGPYPYTDFGIETHLLNEERFGIAFPLRIDPDEAIDPRLVNSILRPTLPGFDLADIRNPW